MTQPFRDGDIYHSSIWSGVSLKLLDNRIETRCNERLYSLSSAIHPGGFSYSDLIFNWKVPLDYVGSDPVSDIVKQCEAWDYDLEHSIGFLTAAKLTHASIIEFEGDKFKLLCCSTVGTRNAARSGITRSTFSAYSPGTINTIILIDGQMTESAMVNAVITATEAKTAALQHLGIVEYDNGQSATGTTTDAIVIAVSQAEHWQALHAYAGTATTIGCAIGEAVYDTVLEAASTQHED
ncbi:adenosylcobinamide amidohydrolase [Paenibacillus castaneae]|uniref:adenosylcobinamide amidohydrolase n=1 Tax=Paenibacillus castaneae TaxID=474957 RepID=UPI000C9C121F|nr:adenosylcobinamide amidohydrolase [Paenibacillus castaneae]NIK75461.1 adenosylcobinamide amidohydrolase [Paenibacillus castaneae]